jgi:hypothetical protein
MKSIEINTHFGDKPVHIEISAPTAGGDVYNGRVWKTGNGRQHDLNRKTISRAMMSLSSSIY